MLLGMGNAAARKPLRPYREPAISEIRLLMKAFAHAGARSENAGDAAESAERTTAELRIRFRGSMPRGLTALAVSLSRRDSASPAFSDRAPPLRKGLLRSNRSR